VSKHKHYEDIAPRVKVFVKNFWLANNYSPSSDEVCRALGFTTKSVVYRWLHIMRERGELIFEDNLGRNFRLPNQYVVFKDKDDEN
jgi:hypothetical protein